MKAFLIIVRDINLIKAAFHTTTETYRLNYVMDKLTDIIEQIKVSKNDEINMDINNILLENYLQKISPLA